MAPAAEVRIGFRRIGGDTASNRSIRRIVNGHVGSHFGCATYKWKLSRPAFLPVVFKLTIQMAAAESQDRVGSSNGPEHSRPFETESHHRLATSFNDARTNK